MLKQAVPFFGVKDVSTSLPFYVHGLGFEVIHRWEPDGNLRWCWVQRDGVAFMLQNRDPSRPVVGLGEGVTISIQCDDALAIYREIIHKGLKASRPFVGNGMWVFSVVDPDGYRIEFESLTDTPEGTELAE